MVEERVTATAVFQELLKSLCLTEFPCGIGSWRRCTGRFADEYYSTTTKDYDAQKEKIESLHEFLCSGTWDANATWSNDALKLRFLAVSEPRKINEDFIWQHFETLRLIDKEIAELDDGLKKLVNLKELTLSVNKLKKVSADRLPSKLKVLELCYNELDSIISLARHSQNLMHLGMSYNRLASSQEYKYLTVDYWPALMSLDLGYNDLLDLVELVVCLSTVPNLQNLVLMGNPLSLIPGYRGHVVDAIKNLKIFDDSHITADERHHFKGLGKKKELILDEAQLIIALDVVSGIPVNDDMKDSDERPEIPIIKVQYHVEYSMLPDEYPCERNIAERHASVLWHPEESVIDETSPGDVIAREPTNALQKYTTQNVDWNEEAIDLHYRKVHVTDNLIGLRDFLKCGVKFTIYEERISLWPVSPIEENEVQGIAPNNKKGKTDSTDKNTPTKAGKSKDKAAKGSGKEKGKKPIRELTSDMRSDPPIITEVGSCHVLLSNFVDGDSEYLNICHCGGGPMPAVTIDENIVLDQITLDHSKSLPRKGNEKKAVPEDTKPKSGKVTGSKKGARGAEKPLSSTAPQPNSEDDNMQLPLPITLSVNMELIRWKTAADSMKQS